MNRIGSKIKIISIGKFNFEQGIEYYNLTVLPLQDV